MSHAQLFFMMLIAALPYISKGNTNDITDSWANATQAYARCIRCHLEHLKAGSKPIDGTESYIRHRVTGNCRSHKGTEFTETPAEKCAYHTNPRVKKLLTLCGSAVTYHDAYNAIKKVEADTVPGKRAYVHGGAYIHRLSAKPRADHAVAWLCPTTEHIMISFVDKNGHTIITFACKTPPNKITESSWWLFWQREYTYYELDQRMLNTARKYIVIDSITRAVPITNMPRKDCRYVIADHEWRR